MFRHLFSSLCLAVILLSACNKDNGSTGESIFTGTWVKGSNTGDTLRFFNRNGKNLLAYNQSFNAAIFAPAEIEYRFKNNRLGLKNYLAQSNNFFTSQSFEWVRTGSEFKLNGTELYPFMASSLVMFTYHKIP